jgi:hypothetical protein
MAEFPTKCNKCGSTWKWNKEFDPPEGSTRAKEGKPGWWEVDGKPHYKEQCESTQGTKGAATGSNNFTFTSDILLMNVVRHDTITQGANYALQAIESAESMMQTLYQGKVPDSLKGQIRNALTQNILLGQQNEILKLGLANLAEKVEAMLKASK